MCVLLLLLACYIGPHRIRCLAATLELLAASNSQGYLIEIQTIQVLVHASLPTGVYMAITLWVGAA